MKEKTMPDNPDDFKPDIPLEVIAKSVAGDKDAIQKVLEAYEPYIIEMSKVDGVFDEDLAQTLRLKMIEAIPNFKMEE